MVLRSCSGYLAQAGQVGRAREGKQSADDKVSRALPLLMACCQRGVFWLARPSFPYGARVARCGGRADDEGDHKKDQPEAMSLGRAERVLRRADRARSLQLKDDHQSQDDAGHVAPSRYPSRAASGSADRSITVVAVSRVGLNAAVTAKTRLGSSSDHPGPASSGASIRWPGSASEQLGLRDRTSALAHLTACVAVRAPDPSYLFPSSSCVIFTAPLSGVRTRSCRAPWSGSSSPRELQAPPRSLRLS